MTIDKVKQTFDIKWWKVDIYEIFLGGGAKPNGYEEGIVTCR